MEWTNMRGYHFSVSVSYPYPFIFQYFSNMPNYVRYRPTVLKRRLRAECPAINRHYGSIFVRLAVTASKNREITRNSDKI